MKKIASNFMFLWIVVLIVSCTNNDVDHDVSVVDA